MTPVSKKILAASIVVILNSASNVWADSTGGATSNADSISSSTAIVAVNNNAPSTAANATDAATNGSGNAWSDRSNHSTADASGQGVAAANNGGTALAMTDKSWSNVNGAGSASANGNGIATTLNNDNSDDSQAQANGAGAVAANNGGSATGNYRVSNQTLSGIVTGNSSILPSAAATISSLPAGNSIDQALIGNAGITQTFQNSGSGLAQQSVSVDGTVTVIQGSAALVP